MSDGNDTDALPPPPTDDKETKQEQKSDGAEQVKIHVRHSYRKLRNNGNNIELHCSLLV